MNLNENDITNANSRLIDKTDNKIRPEENK